jgi:tRNA (guanine-N7-)-methyltransferase
MLNQNANDLLEQVFPDESLDKIYILYPDPWPKNRHEKRRLIREATYQRYHQVLKPGGEIEIWTDSEKWVTLSLPFLKQLSGSIEQEEVADDTRDLRTLFERKAKSKGHPIFHILYKK